MSTGKVVYLASAHDFVLMFHEPRSSVARSVGVLLCPPFGWQEQASYRSVRGWAQRLSDAGYPTARLTLPGTGDSAGSAFDENLLERWTDAVGQSARWLTSVHRCTRVVAVGVGLGGQLAWRAMAQGSPIDDVVLWAVPESGRKLLREMRAHSRLVAQQVAGSSEEVSPEPDNLVGFRISEDTSRALEGLRMPELVPSHAAGGRGLLIRRGTLEPPRSLVEHLRAVGLTVEICDGEDFDDLVANPQQSLVPTATAERVIEWLAAGPTTAERCIDGPTADERPTLRAEHDQVEERPLRLRGERGEMFGIVSSPSKGDPAPVGLVFLGGGALPHTGPSRNWVEISRRWAARGMNCVRVDLYGIGESAGDSADLLTDESFAAPWRAADTQRILNHLVDAGIAERFVLAGLCSGANVAMQTALLDDRVGAIMLLNMFGFRYSQALAAERGRRLQIEHGLPGARARKLDLDLIRAAMNYARPDRAWRLWRRSEERAEARRARQILDQLRERDVATLLLLGSHEPMAAQFERDGFMRDAAGRWPALVYETIETRDHMLRDLAVQRAFHAMIDSFLERAVASNRSQPAAGGTDRSADTFIQVPASQRER